MAPLTFPVKPRLLFYILLFFAGGVVLGFCAAIEDVSPPCPFSSPASLDDDHHLHDHAHHHHHHHHGDDHDHDHGQIQRRKLPEELAEEEDLAQERSGHDHHHHHFHPDDSHELELSRLGIWIRAMGCSLLVSMASLICLILLPLIFFQGRPSKAVVDCLAVFGAGAMLGMLFLHQLPHAFGGEHSHSYDHNVSFGGVHSHDHGHGHAHSTEDLSVGLSILSGIVLFFLVEKIVRYVEDHSANDIAHVHHHQHKRYQKLKDDGNDKHKLNQKHSDLNYRKALDSTSEEELNGQTDEKDDMHDEHDSHQKRTCEAVTSDNVHDFDDKNVKSIQKHTLLNESTHFRPSNLVFGYLNLFSDGVHNFTDGMALGSAFLLHGSVGGWSRTLFLLAHELPQEVGDFGILVRSGFSVSKALCFNFLSALVALAGTALALVLGKDPGHSSLIEGFTAGASSILRLPEFFQK
ncbi:hypothetical protein HPP92_005450 [Vanilla planifolia]|uniref:IAA-alanine resistance protein 1 n=1 Tax=Vanilla planifolia TaxID=51239 RepID=A0A835VFE6_VANPL|nr:hypothetical protein HPP92_005450 [Vanilla planifolia]